MFMLDRSMQNMEASSHCCILCIAILMGKPYRRSKLDLLYGFSMKRIMISMRKAIQEIKLLTSCTAFPIRMVMHEMQQ